MKICLIDVDSKIPNLALMKLSAFHKGRGDEVGFYNPLFDQPDRVYMSKIFNFTPDFAYVPDCEVIRGGSGCDLKAELPADVESMYPDYDIYGCEYAMGFTTRGCIRKCHFCIVPEKEGKIRAVGDIYDFWRGQKEIVLLDNNLTALPDQFEKICKQLIKEKVRVDFNQGLDIRLLTGDMIKILSKIRVKEYRFAFDDPKHEKVIRDKVRLLNRHGIKTAMFYVLVGFNTTFEQDIHRLNLLKSLGQKAYVMRYKRTPEYIPLAEWANQRHLFVKTTYEQHLAKRAKRRQSP